MKNKTALVTKEEVDAGIAGLLSRAGKPDKKELLSLTEVIKELRQTGKISLAYLFGSFASGEQSKTSDIDLAVFINHKTDKDWINVRNRILMSTDRDIHLLRLDNDEEDPAIVADVMRHGIPLVEITDDNLETYYDVSIRAYNAIEEISARSAYVG